MMNLPDIATEDRLLASARRGNRDAIMQIYDQYFPPVYKYIRLRVREQNTAEDLASDVFLKFMAALRGENAPRHSLRGWMFRVARNAVYDHYGKVQQFPTATLDEWLPSADNPETQSMQQVNIESIQRALGMLVDEQQEVVILRFLEMLSLKETAEVMGKSVSAVKSLQFRALDTLRRILAGGMVHD